jgi:hypothetical protein
MCRIVVFKNVNGEEFPAIVRKVNAAGNADLSVFGPDGVFPADDIPSEGEGATWRWPERTDTVTETPV